jgi:Rho-binding antiterminator
MDQAYEPIACALHDRLEAWATTGRSVEIIVRDEHGGERVVVDRLVDVYARGGAEYVRTGAGEEIRLDRLVSVDGVAFGGGEEDRRC